MSQRSTEPEPRIVSAEFVAAAARVDQVPPATSMEIAFAGRSNVGKSSLMNSLLSRKNLVRTSSTPGCTRQIAFFEARSADGVELRLVDLPGYGYAKRSKSERAEWANLIERYLLERATLCAVVVLVDARRGLETEDRDLLELLATRARVSRRALGTILVATKLDKLPNSSQRPSLARLERAIGQPIIGYSAKTNVGRVELWRQIRKTLGLLPQGTVPPASAGSSSRPQSP